MLNILGTRNGNAEPKGFDEIEKEEGTYVHLYGKHETRVGRKMGHVTVTAPTVEAAREKAEKIRSRVTI
jgi:5-(carboxyamino)imidazole ribonucleotide synthase